MKNTIRNISVALFLGLFIASCSNNANQKKIIGKWKGVYDNTCRDPQLSPSKTIVEIEYTKDGKCVLKQAIAGSNIDAASPTVMTYKIEGDSLILNWDNPSFKGEKEYIAFLSDEELILKNYSKMNDDTPCEGTTSVKRINN